MSREDILSIIGTVEPEPLEIPEWGTTVDVKRHTVGEWNALFMEGPDNDRVYRIISESVINGDGRPIFSIDDIKGMPSTQSQVLLRLYTKCRQINGDLGDDLGEV